MTNPLLRKGNVPAVGLRGATPVARIAALADPGSADYLPPSGASPHLARFGIAAHEDDGLVLARVRVHGVPMLVAAQDERYLAGSVGERHGAALQAMVAVSYTQSDAADE
jgi:malonate decarboxylase beta subunit